jgi:hypothetical protein
MIIDVQAVLMEVILEAQREAAPDVTHEEDEHGC